MSIEKDRRQPFITNAYYVKVSKILSDWNDRILINFSNPLIADDIQLLQASMLCENCYELMSLLYTAGEQPEKLVPRLEATITAYEKERELSILSYGSTEASSGFGDSLEYEQFLQTIGLCILLGRGELTLRLTAIFDRDNKGQDALYEFFASFYDNNRIKTDELFFKRPFSGLLNVIRASTPQEATKLLDKYCKDWYSAFKKATWYDSHLSTDDDEGNYTGYWAFEAGAVAFLLNIDDSEIDHMVYPKDLVAYARNFSSSSSSTQIGRVESGQPCPKAGYWFTPAQANSRRAFKQGEIMPAFEDSRWGATLWYWSGEDNA